jgi:hypothetical protein
VIAATLDAQDELQPIRGPENETPRPLSRSGRFYCLGNPA